MSRDAPVTCTWEEFVCVAPEFAASAARLLESHAHHVIATVRSDGSPRVGGTSVFIDGGVLWIGMMPVAARVGDLRRDPRCSVHTAPLDVALKHGDLRLDLVAEECSPSLRQELLDGSESKDGIVFTLALKLVSIVKVEGDELVIDSWEPHRGITSIRLTS